MNRQDLANLVFIRNHLNSLLDSNYKLISKERFRPLINLVSKIDKVFLEEVEKEDLFAENPSNNLDLAGLSMLLAPSSANEPEEELSAQQVIEDEHNSFVDDVLEKDPLFKNAKEAESTAEKESPEVSDPKPIVITDDVTSKIAAERAKVAEKLAKEAEIKKKKAAAKK